MKKGVIILAVGAAFYAAVPIMGETRYVNSKDGLCVRAKADKDSEILEVLPFGSELEVKKITKDGEWLKISYEGEKAYVAAEYAQVENPLDAYTYMGTWRTTAYAYTGSPCANGNYPQTGYTIACNSLPFGTEVYIKGVGFRTVEDRGPTSMGDAWLDIYMGDVGQCIQWGDQYLDVYIVED